VPVKALLLLAAVATSLGLLPTTEDTKPTIEVLYPNHSFAWASPPVRELDLKESEVIIFGERGRMWVKGRLHRGLYEVSHKVGGEWLRLNRLKFPTAESGKPESGVAYFDWVSTGASASDYGVLQVLQIRDGHLYVAQQIEFNTRGSSKAGATFSPETNVLTIQGVHGWEHCCATELDVVRFRFEGGVFKQAGYHKTPLQ